MTRNVRLLAALGVAFACLACGGGSAPEPDVVPALLDAPEVPRVVVLGTAQDGGVPHAACGCPRCQRAATDPAFQRRAPSLAIVVPGSKPFLIDASPDLPEQLRALGAVGDDRVDRVPLAGLLLTHAHIGHYAGLVHLGREVVGARGIPVYATPAMCAFLEAHAPWQQLVALGNVELRQVAPGTAVDVGGGVRLRVFPVPHRDEYADTVGVRIDGPDAAVLYVPDTDRWETWDPPVEDRLQGVDVALLDATFHDLSELPGRTIEEVPHPPMTVTMDRLQSRVDAGLRVVFTHLNHSNPAVDPDSAEARKVRARGFEIADDGDVVPLATPVRP